MTTLNISPNLPLPLDAVTQRLAFLGKPGSGKSYAASKLAELMYGAGAQFIALDPVGVWYGLRLDGRGKGIPIPVFGGLHGDVPLTPTSGAVFADLIVDRRLSCVLDTSQFEHDTDKARFAAGFANRFFFRMKAAPAAVHLFLEECQEWVPQNPQRGEEHMLHDFTRIDKLGRNFGIGVSLISQRPQEVNKKVLNLTECLFAFQMTGAHERKAIKDWIASVGADENILTTLPTLEIAHAHVYSPQWLKVSAVVKIGEKRTADVSSTPAVGESKVASKPLTPVDLEQIKGAIADTIEKAKVDDPTELRKRIRDLEREVRAAANAGRAAPGVDEAALNRRIKQAVAPYRERVDGLEVAGGRLLRTIATFAEQLTTTGGALSGLVSKYRDAFNARPVGEVNASVEDSRADVQVGYREQGTGANHPSTSTVRQQSRSTTRAAVTPTGDRKPGQQKILNALAELEVLGVPAATRHQLGMVAKYNLTGGTGAQHIADLVSAGLVELPDKGVVRLTDAGRASADASDVPTTLDELHERVLSKLPDGQRRIAEHLIAIYPSAISRAELGAAVNYNLTGGTGAQHVADLVTVGAARIPGAGKVIASDLLFPEGLR